jgi:mannosyltransferase OCH1-like enzyme
MIPKIIHYCWFGDNPLPELAQKCIASWKKHCPDYEIREWNEENFNLKSNPYIQEAYSAKKWAFITDYVRLWVIFNYGGIYMDTDVEVLKSLDKFLVHPAFSGFESNNTLPTGIMGGEVGNAWYKTLLDYYTDRHFILPDGVSYDMTNNVITITKITKERYKVQLNNSCQILDNEVIFYPSNYFCPKNFRTGLINITDNTYCIHHFAGSWCSEIDKKNTIIRYKIYHLLGINYFSRAILIFIFIIQRIKRTGLLNTMSYYINRFIPPPPPVG